MTVRPPLWQDRRDAGLGLGHRFAAAGALPADTALLGLPRGGVVVAAAMAEVLHRPVWPWSVRKIVDPHWPELALGAIAAGGVTLWRPEVDRRLRERAQREGWLAAQQQEWQRRQRLYGDPPASTLAGRDLIVVDDGIATGMTVKAALVSLRPLQPRALTLAVPVVDRSILTGLLPLVDHVEALAVVDDLRAVGEWYVRFAQVEDGEVQALLARQALSQPPAKA